MVTDSRGRLFLLNGRYAGAVPEIGGRSTVRKKAGVDNRAKGVYVNEIGGRGLREAVVR
jgi:hypothetical protein